MTKLDRLLESIHPARTTEELSRRADDVLNSFAPEAAQIDHWDRFRYCLMRFVDHAQNRLLRLSKPCPMGLDFAWGRCCQVLMRAYGSDGEKAAFEMARTGNEGGLSSVLRKMAQVMADEYADNEIAAKISSYWNGLSVEEKLAAGDEYLAKHGHLLPSELTEGSAARIRANLPKVLQEHSALVRRLRKIGPT